MRRSKLGVCLIGIAVWNTKLDIGVFLQWAIIGEVVVEPYFKGIQPVKRIKRVVHFIITLFLEILDHWQTSNQFDMKISVDDIAFSVVFTTVFTVYIRDGMSSIGDSWTDEVTKNIFLNNNTFHLIIMMISVVLCKINEEINYVSIFHNHVVRIWLHNRPAKLSWNRNKNSKLQMLCLEYIVWWYGQFVTNWYHFIEMSFHST